MDKAISQEILIGAEKKIRNGYLVGNVPAAKVIHENYGVGYDVKYN